MDTILRDFIYYFIGGMVVGLIFVISVAVYHFKQKRERKRRDEE